MIAMTKDLVCAVIEKLADQEPGEWVLLGGSLGLAVNATHRATFDIDLGRADMADLFTPAGLIGIAESLGIPIEAINQAANIYLHRQTFDGWLVPLVKGAKSTVYRPHFDLYLRMKLERLSVTDAHDIIAYAQRFPEEVEVESLRHLWPDLIKKHGHKPGWPQLVDWIQMK